MGLQQSRGQAASPSSGMAIAPFRPRGRSCARGPAARRPVPAGRRRAGARAGGQRGRGERGVRRGAGAAGRGGASRARPRGAGGGESAELPAEDQALLESAMKGEVIEVWAERPNKAFDRDTELRITGAELARRGVTDLAQALEYLPEINVRAVSRGGKSIDVRGARKGSVKVLIDGVPIGD